MLKLIKGVGWLLLGLAGVCVLCIPAVVFDSSTNKSDTIFGFFLFAAFFGLPGALLLWRGRAMEKRVELAGFLRTHDRFTADEIAQKFGINPLETEKLILRLAQEEKLDVVFHRADRSYMQRNRIAVGARVLDVCPSCGARLPHEVALEGEQPRCVYCGTAMT